MNLMKLPVSGKIIRCKIS